MDHQMAIIIAVAAIAIVGGLLTILAAKPAKKPRYSRSWKNL